MLRLTNNRRCLVSSVFIDVRMACVFPGICVLYSLIGGRCLFSTVFTDGKLQEFDFLVFSLGSYFSLLEN